MFELAGSDPRSNGCSARETTAAIIGVEHEFYLSRAGQQVDFREIIDSLGLPGRRIDPTDKRAYRLLSGHVITCDDQEAEYAIAPVAARPGFARQVDQACRAVAGELHAALPTDIKVEGASTHISVSCPDRFAPRVCAMITQHFAPALMLLAEDGASFGLLVRPRFGRVEFGVDYVSDASLRATVAMAVGAVQACLAVLEHRLSPYSLPPRLIVAATPARRRYGLYVSRRAFPGDLYIGGRNTRLRLAEGGATTAGEHLELAWKCARSGLGALAGPDDVAEADDMVAGLRSIPVETERSLEMLCSDRRVDTPFAGLLDPETRPGFVVSPVVLTWELAVFVISGQRRAYAVVPRDDLELFGRNLRSGQLDQVVDSYLSTTPTGRDVPAYPGAVRQPQLYDYFESRSRLVTPERARNGMLELEDGTVLTRTAPGLPSAPGMWAAASGEPEPSDSTLTSVPRSTGLAAETSSTTSAGEASDDSPRRHGKIPLPPGSVELEDPGRGCFSRIARIVGVGLAVAVLGAALTAAAFVGISLTQSGEQPPATTTTSTTTAAGSTTSTTGLTTSTTTAAGSTTSTTGSTTSTTTAAGSTTSTTGSTTSTTTAAGSTTSTTAAPTTSTTTTTTTTTTIAPATSKTVMVNLPCPPPIGGQSWIDVNIPATATGTSHVLSPNPWVCPDTTVSVSGFLLSPGIYRVLFTATGGTGAPPETTVSTTVTVSWTNP